MSVSTNKLFSGARRARSRLATLLTAAAMVAMMGRAAVAIDGVVLIDQQAALLGNDLLGDAPGFPFTIWIPGTSYRLTSNLYLLDQPNGANLTAIHVTGRDVTLDLNGFTIFGASSCGEAPPTNCSGVGRGIDASSADATGFAIRNGTIRGMAGYGVYVAPGATIERVRFLDNQRAVYALGDAIISDCSFTSNHTAVLSNEFAVITDNTFHANTIGLLSDGASVITGNSVRGTSTDTWTGITASFSVVRQNASSGNGGRGISCPRCVMTGNTSVGNGAEGMAGTESVVAGNALYDNTGFGLTSSGAGPFYVGNVLVENNGGDNPQVFSGTQLGLNFCGTNTSCP